MQLSLAEPLHAHLFDAISSLRLPSASLLYDARITLDLATMLYARETIFSESADVSQPWSLHIRADSSPQFGRDFLVCQADVVHVGTKATDATICKRLLQIHCVGSRAASANQKLEKLVHALKLESEHDSKLNTIYFFIFLKLTL